MGANICTFQPYNPVKLSAFISLTKFRAGIYELSEYIKCSIYKFYYNTSIVKYFIICSVTLDFINIRYL